MTLELIVAAKETPYRILQVVTSRNH